MPIHQTSNFNSTAKWILKKKIICKNKNVLPKKKKEEREWQKWNKNAKGNIISNGKIWWELSAREHCIFHFLLVIKRTIFSFFWLCCFDMNEQNRSFEYADSIYCACNGLIHTQKQLPFPSDLR